MNDKRLTLNDRTLNLFFFLKSDYLISLTTEDKPVDKTKTFRLNQVVHIEPISCIIEL